LPIDTSAFNAVRPPAQIDSANQSARPARRLRDRGGFTRSGGRCKSPGQVFVHEVAAAARHADVSVIAARNASARSVERPSWLQCRRCRDRAASPRKRPACRAALQLHAQHLAGDLHLPPLGVKPPAITETALPVGPDWFAESILSGRPYRMKALVSMATRCWRARTTAK